jgi:ComF family protein
MNFLCLLCHESAQQKFALCQDCEKMLPYAQPSRNENNFIFDKTVILFDYLFPIDRLITQLKFQHQLINATLLGKLLLHKIIPVYQNEPYPEVLIPVPLHFKRLRERGFNQALEIAKPMSKKLHIPIDNYSCHRIKHTAAQSTLTQQERLKNLKQAFALKKSFANQHIALIDDVITTGQTLKELATLLRNDGVAKIDVWCCARTPFG